MYRARDTRLERTVAVKVLPEHIAQRPEAGARFEREARAVASLNHPHICTLFDIGPGYMVMELVEGETLAARIEKGAVPLAQALVWAGQLADALDRAHRAGVDASGCEAAEHHGEAGWGEGVGLWVGEGGGGDGGADGGDADAGVDDRGDGDGDAAVYGSGVV